MASDTIPGPAAVWEQLTVLIADHSVERAKERSFYERQEKRIAEMKAADPKAEIKVKNYVGQPTYVDKILTSLKTVFTGFLIGTIIAIPLGILAGLSPTVNAAINPLVPSTADVAISAGIPRRKRMPVAYAYPAYAAPATSESSTPPGCRACAAG